MAESDGRALGAAAFLAQALDLADDPAALAADLLPVSEEPVVAVYAAELDSSAGPAAFLVYAYALAATDPQGQSGEARFAADLATLERAAQLDAPGPRAVAHARTEASAFLLATTPATLRTLTGEADSVAAGDPATATDTTDTRRSAAAELLRLLRLANDEAAAWTRAVRAARQPGAAGAAIPTDLDFLPEETELALFLLDERSIKDLLGALDALLTIARRRPPGPPTPAD